MNTEKHNLADRQTDRQTDRRFSAQIKRANTDEWYTTTENVEIIVPFLLNKGFHKILCPFDTEESNYVKVLQEYGFDVTFGHINTGQDFFKRTDLKHFDAIVSNPPFSKRDAILEKLFESNKPFAIIQNMNGLFDSKRRWELFKDNKFELVIPLGRMKFFNESGNGNSPNFQSIYVCKDICNKTFTFVRGSNK